jgi:predicted secreted protein
MGAFIGRLVTVSQGAVDLEDELRTTSVTFNGELVNITTKGDDGWTDHLDGVHGEKNWTVTVDGIIKTDTLVDHAESGDKEAYTITVGDLFQLTGDWQIQSGFEIGAPYNDATTFSATLISSGEIVKSAVPA